MSLLSCSALKVGYEGRVVLEGVSLELSQGDIVALLGPNGGGKSTLLRALAGLIPKISGSILIGDKPIEQLGARDVARHIGFVPQEEAWKFDFSVEEVVAMGRLPVSNGFFDTEEDISIARSAMERAGCIHLRDRPVTEVSGGERQRVLIARALAQETPILFLDEPTSHLDPKYQMDTANLVRELGAAGKAVLVAVHDLPIAGVMADRGILVGGGAASDAVPMTELLGSPDLDRAYGAEFQRLFADGRLVVVPKPSR